MYDFNIPKFWKFRIKDDIEFMSDLHIIVYADNFQLHMCVWFVVWVNEREIVD